MQTLRGEIKKRDDQSLKTQLEYEARMQDLEARLQQAMESRSQVGEDHPGQPVDEEMELITPEVAAALSAAAHKQKGKSSEASKRYDIDTRSNTGQPSRSRRVAFQNVERRTPYV